MPTFSFLMKLRWRFGIIAGLFLAVFSLYPQFKLVYNRGAEWNGHYAYNDIDEVAYASYLKALIDGRPRKNDPYTGRDDSPETPQQESLFSIQFVAPYSIAIPARILGIGAPWAMTISGAVAAFLTALAIFWLIGMITGDSLYAMAGSLFVLCGGALFAGEGAIGEILGTSYSYPYFPGFRRYVPAMAFPAFFALVALVWKMLAENGQQSAVGGRQEIDHKSQEEHESPRSKIQDLRSRTSSSHLLLVSVSTLCFGYAVFSYFYVWTTAVAWLTCLGSCWLVAQPAGFVKDIKILTGLAVGCMMFLAPYAYLLVNRSRSMDEVQILVRTHTPDLIRVPELISFGVLILIGVCILLKILALKDRGTLFAISLALTQIAVFNQQVITGQELQPIHYQVFIGNYVAGLAVVVTLGLIWRSFEGRSKAVWRCAVAGVAMTAAAWGFVECHYTVRILDDVNVARDEALPVARRLTEIGKNDPEAHKKVVLHLGMAEADDLPTIAPQSVLWARHQHVFSGLTSWQENKVRYYQLLYYQGISGRQIAQAMKRGEDFVSMIALFGWGRHTDRLNSAYKPLTFGEIDEDTRIFDEYCRNFDPSRPDAVRLDYLIAPAVTQPFFDNIDKWYSRDEGETFGKYVLYKLKPR